MNGMDMGGPPGEDFYGDESFGPGGDSFDEQFDDQGY